MVDDITERNQTDEALRDANQFNIEIVSQAGEGIIVYDRDLRYVVWNRFMERMTGTKAKDVIGRNALDIFPNLHEQGVDQLLKRALNGETVTSPDISFFSTLTNHNGWVVGTYAPHRNACGEIIGVIATLKDITERKQIEKELRDSESKFAAIIEFLPDATFVIDLEGKVVAWNRAIEEMTGICKGDMIGQGDHAYTVPFYGERRQQLLDLLDEDDREIASKYQFVLRKGDTLYAETFAPALNGGKGAYVWATGGPIYDVHGNRAGATESIRDITERKREQGELQNNLRFLETMINTIPSPIFFKDRQGRYLGCNDTFARQILGMPKESIIGKSVYEFPESIPSNLADKYYEQDQELFRESGIQVYETQVQCADGVRRDFLFSKATFNNFTGEVAGIVGVMLDITERKQMETALREARDYLDKIINSIGDPIFVVDRQHRHVMVNDAMCELSNRTREDFIGKTPYDFFPKEQVDVYLQKDEVVFETGKENVNEETITDSHGVVRTIITKKTLYTDASGNKSIVGIIRDITDRKKAEEELRQNRDHLEEHVRERTAEMERFIYTVSHDLRSPLVTISGFVGLLKEDLEKGDSKRAFCDLLTISEAITKMDRLLVDTLELSRIGRVANPPVDAPFGEIVQEALMQTAERIKSRNVTVYVAEDMPKVRVDVLRIAEVLVNLIENSVKYLGDQACPEIHIGSRKDGEETVFFVRDNGIGIDLKEQEKVFGLFYKVNRKSEGTGVGLAIVKRIIEVHGGRIWIESEPCKGCTVCFTLPLA